MTDQLHDDLARALEDAGDYITHAPHGDHCQLQYSGNDCTCGLQKLADTVGAALSRYREAKEGEGFAPPHTAPKHLALDCSAATRAFIRRPIRKEQR